MAIELFIDFLISKTEVTGNDIAKALWISFNSKKNKKIENILVDEKIVTKEDMKKYLKEFKKLSLNLNKNIDKNKSSSNPD